MPVGEATLGRLFNLIGDPIDEGDPDSGFECGEPPLDAFFARHALRNDRRGLGRTFVLRRSQGDQGSLPPILGFYTLSMADLEATRVPAERAERTPTGWIDNTARPGDNAYPIPSTFGLPLTSRSA